MSLRCVCRYSASDDPTNPQAPVINSRMTYSVHRRAAIFRESSRTRGRCVSSPYSMPDGAISSGRRDRHSRHPQQMVARAGNLMGEHSMFDDAKGAYNSRWQRRASSCMLTHEIEDTEGYMSAYKQPRCGDRYVSSRPASSRVTDGQRPRARRAAGAKQVGCRPLASVVQARRGSDQTCSGWWA